MITQAINLNLIPGQVLPRVNVSQYDYGSRTLEFKLFNGNQSFTLTSSMTANISGTKADMHGFEYDATVDTTNQKIVADLTQQMTATAGDVTCELIIKKSGERLGTCNFVISVEKAALGDDAIISDTELPVIIAEAAAQMEAAAQSASEAASSAQAAEESADIAEIYGAHPPYIGVNGNWYVYNVTTQQYEDSGVKAQGPLSGLTDVEISNLAENDIIAYDAIAQKWKNSSEFQTLTNQVKDMNNVLGAKNLISLSVETQTVNGVTITVQDDGSIILNGTATAAIYLGLTNSGIPLKSGKCILSGANGGGLGSYWLFTSRAGGATLYQEIDGQRTAINSRDGDSAIFDINKMNTTPGSSYVDPSDVNIRLGIANGYTCNNVLIKPMIRLASISDDTYEPYAKTNQQLTKDVEHTGNIEPMLNVLGAKNLLPNNAMSQTINGVVFTVNDDGSVTANGTATATIILFLYGGQSFADKNIFKGMKLKGCPSGSISSNYQLVAQGFTTSTLDNPVWYADNGNGVILGNDNYIRVYIRIASGVTVSNLTFRPMICLTELEDDTYVPYAKTNRELTEKTASIESDISAINIQLSQLDFDGAGAHNSIYRGKYLGAEVTAEQYTHIADGTFKDMYIGDYWTIGGVNYRIGAFDYWYNTGDTACTTHHVLIVPDTGLVNGQMNSTNTTTGGYVGSDLKTGNNSNTALVTAKNKINNAFGSSHILSHREYFTNAVADGKPSGGAWYDSDIDLMNENMVYGTNIFLPHPDGGTVPNLYTIDKTQIKLFAERPDLITIRAYWWLRDVVSAVSFAHVGYDGIASYANTLTSRDVRPAFAIKG